METCTVRISALQRYLCSRPDKLNWFPWQATIPPTLSRLLVTDTVYSPEALLSFPTPFKQWLYLHFYQRHRFVPRSVARLTALVAWLLHQLPPPPPLCHLWWFYKETDKVGNKQFGPFCFVLYCLSCASNDCTLCHALSITNFKADACLNVKTGQDLITPLYSTCTTIPPTGHKCNNNKMTQKSRLFKLLWEIYN